MSGNPRRYLTTREVVIAMNFPHGPSDLEPSLHWFYKNHRHLESMGFPKPVRFTRGGPQLFDPLAIEAWQNRLCAELAPELVMGARAEEESDEAKWTRELERRLAPVQA